MQAVEEETFRIDVSRRRSIAEVARNYTRFRSNDVLFAKITPCMENGKLAVVPATPERVLAGSTEFHVLRSEKLEPKYLTYWLSQHMFRQDARRHMTGTAGQMRVPAEYLRMTALPVPDKSVQRLIVCQIDELFSDIDESETALTQARADLEIYRRSLLKAAVTGELTADWCAANPPQESGAALLARILADRRARWHEDPKNKGKRYSEAKNLDTTGLTALPESWVLDDP